MVTAFVIIGYLFVGFVVGVVWNIINEGAEIEITSTFCLFGWPVAVPLGLTVLLTKRILGY